MKAKIVEVFKSVQGEGLYVGCLQTFIRFYGCNLHCAYCDTPLRHYIEYTAEELFEKLLIYKIPFVSLTGGEPLLQTAFLKEFLPRVKKRKFEVFLETNGTFPIQLKKIITWVDIISCDIKLKSSTGQRALWTVHEKFFNVARKKELFLKIVITSHTTFNDIRRTARFMENKKKHTVYLQPDRISVSKAFLKRIMSFQEYLVEQGVDARVVPQIHKMLGIK